MATTLKEKLKNLPPKRQEKIALRTNELIAEEKLRTNDIEEPKSYTRVKISRLGIHQKRSWVSKRSEKKQ